MRSPVNKKERTISILEAATSSQHTTSDHAPRESEIHATDRTQSADNQPKTPVHRELKRQLTAPAGLTPLLVDEVARHELVSYLEELHIERTLIVEDNKSIVTSWLKYFSDLGVVRSVIPSSKSAPLIDTEAKGINEIRTNQFDLILFDYELAEGNGAAIAASALNEQPQALLVVISDCKNEHTRTAFNGLNIHAFHPDGKKFFKDSELRSVLKQAVKDRANRLGHPLPPTPISSAYTTDLSFFSSPYHTGSTISGTLSFSDSPSMQAVTSTYRQPLHPIVETTLTEQTLSSNNVTGDSSRKITYPTPRPLAESPELVEEDNSPSYAGFSFNSIVSPTRVVILVPPSSPEIAHDHSPAFSHARNLMTPNQTIPPAPASTSCCFPFFNLFFRSRTIHGTEDIAPTVIQTKPSPQRRKPNSSLISPSNAGETQANSRNPTPNPRHRPATRRRTW